MHIEVKERLVAEMDVAFSNLDWLFVSIVTRMIFLYLHLFCCHVYALQLSNCFVITGHERLIWGIYLRGIELKVA